MEPFPSQASPPSYKLTKKDRKRSSRNPHSDAFPAIVLLETDKSDFLGFPGADTLSSNVAAGDARESFSWRFSLSVPNFDHSVLHLDLCMTKGGCGGKGVNTVLLSIDIPDTEVASIRHSYLSTGQITHIYQECGQSTEATLSAKNIEVEVKQVSLRCRLGRYDIQLSASAKSLVQRIKEHISCVKKTEQTCFTIRLLLPVPKTENSHPIEVWIALLLEAYSRNKQKGGPFKLYKPKSRDLLRPSRRPHIASTRATPRFWSKEQQIVYLRYGITADWERKSGRDEAVGLSMSPTAVAIPSRFHDISGDPTEYILVVKTANLDHDSRRRLPRLRSKVRIQATVEVTRGVFLRDEYGFRSSASSEVVDLNLSECGRDLRHVCTSAASAVVGRDTSPSRGNQLKTMQQEYHKPGKAAKPIRVELGVQDGLRYLFDWISQLLVCYGGGSVIYRIDCVDFMMQLVAEEHQDLVREMFNQLLAATKPPKTGYETWDRPRVWCLIETFIEDLVLRGFTRQPFHAQNKGIWCSAERISLPSSKWDSSCHIYRMKLPISDLPCPWKDKDIPVKLKFPELPLDLTDDQVKERVMSGDYDIKIIIDHETEWDFRIRALQKLFGFGIGPSASRMSRDAVEDYRMMSSRHYTTVGSRFPALAGFTSEAKNQQNVLWSRATHDTPSYGQVRLIQKISQSPHFYILIVGGPGTGKTTIMVFQTMLAAMEPLSRRISQAKTLNKPFAQILVQAGTNSTCDNICARYVNMAKEYNSQKGFHVLRLFDVRDVLGWDEYPKYKPYHDSDMQETLRADWHQEQQRRQCAMIRRICQEWKRQEHCKVSSLTAPGSPPGRSIATVGDPDGFHFKTANSGHQTLVPELTLEGLIAKRLRHPIEKLNKRDAELRSEIMKCMEKEDYFMLCADSIYSLAHEIVSSTQVVVGTPAAICASPIFPQLFRADICVHEDAGSSSEVDTMCLIAEQDPLACFLVGDPDQQESGFFSKRASGDARFKAIQESNPFASQLQTSLLQRMVASCMIPNDEYLCTDHRSNGLVSDVVSKVFYGNRIMAMQKNPSPSPTQTLFRDVVAQKYGQEFSGFAIMIDVKHFKEISSAEGYYNPKHIDEGCQFLQTILRPLRKQFLRDHTDSTRPFSAGVVTPYNSSITEWEKAIEDAGICHMEAHTPGTMPERDFVMVDLVRSDDSGNTGDRSLLISTLSRAKSCMVVLVNTNTLRKTHTPWLARVVNYFKGKKRFIEAR